MSILFTDPPNRVLGLLSGEGASGQSLSDPLIDHFSIIHGALTVVGPLPSSPTSTLHPGPKMHVTPSYPREFCDGPRKWQLWGGLREKETFLDTEGSSLY